MSPPAAPHIPHIPVHTLTWGHGVSLACVCSQLQTPLTGRVVYPDVHAVGTHTGGGAYRCKCSHPHSCRLEHRPLNTQADGGGMSPQSPHVPSTECDCLLCPQSSSPLLHLHGLAPCLPPRPFCLPHCPAGGPPASLASAPWERALWATCRTVPGQRGASNPFVLLTLLVPSPPLASR